MTSSEPRKKKEGRSRVGHRWQPLGRRSAFDLSIKRRLPLLIGTVLFVVISISTFASYQGVKDSAFDSARERLVTLTTYLATQLQQQGVAMSARTATIANDSTVRAFLQSPSNETRDAAIAGLKQIATAQDTGNLQVELWDAAHAPLLTLPEGITPVAATLKAEFKQSEVDSSKALGAIRIINDVPAYPIVAATKDGAGKLLGYLVRWRKLSGSPEARGQLTDIVGNQAVLYIGNAKGDVWTDLVKATAIPPVNLSTLANLSHYKRDGESMMALGRPIIDTPWFLVIEFPTQPLLGQGNPFLRRMMFASLFLLAIGVGAAVLLSRNITKPLQLFTQAAAAIRAGNYSRTVDLNRADELGALAEAFSSMVVSVRDSRRDLARSEYQYRLLFESNPLPMWAFDRETLRFLAVNEAAIHHYGFSREEFLNMTIKEIRPAEEIPRLMKSLSQPIAGLRLSGNWKHQKKDGTVIEVEIAAHAIDFNGKPAALVLTNDVTERVRAEEQLRLQTVALESAANAIVITDELGKVIWVNTAFGQTTGYSREEVLGKNLRFLKSGKQTPAFYRNMWNTILSGKVWRDTIINRRKDGSFNQEHMTITPMTNEAGKITHFVAIKQDITRLQQALAELQAKREELAAMTQQLWQASKLATMGELSASIAHELNNPLATVALRVETLLTQVPEADPKRRSLVIIDQEVDRMAGLVDNLLQFSRRSHRQISTVDVRAEIINSIEFVHYHLRNRQIEVARDFADQLPMIQADRQQLRQLFLNLLTNASDAMPKGGRLTVRAKSSSLAGADAAQIDFADTGEGIPAEHLEKIWDPFFTTKPEGQGTRLGLAICRRIVEEHGGAISIASNPGEGASLQIKLPVTATGRIQFQPEDQLTTGNEESV